MNTRLVLGVTLLICWLPCYPVTCNFLDKEENQVERGEEEVVEEEAERARDVDPPAQLQYPLEGNVDPDGHDKVEAGPGEVAKEPEKEEEDYEKLKVVLCLMVPGLCSTGLFPLFLVGRH